MSTIQENTRWEQALEAMEAKGVLNLTIDELLAVIEITMTGEWKSISGGENYQLGMWEPSSPLSPTQAARLSVVQRLTAEHSALLSWTEGYGFASILTVATILTTSTGGSLTALAAWGLLSQLALLDELGSNETDLRLLDM